MNYKFDENTGRGYPNRVEEREEKGFVYICSEISTIPASGGPITEAAPRKRQSNPKAFVSLSSPSISTRMIDVKQMYAAG